MHNFSEIKTVLAVLETISSFVYYFYLWKEKLTEIPCARSCPIQ